MVSSGMQIITKQVASFTSGRKGYLPEAVVIHNLEEPDADTAITKFTDPNSRSSLHYIVCQDGRVLRLIHEKDTAWHAGGVAEHSWELLKPNINPDLYTIGIGHEVSPNRSWSAATYKSSAELIAEICSRWQIPATSQHIIGHSAINSLNHADDPGSATDLKKLIRMVNSAASDTPEYELLKERILSLEQTQEILMDKLSTLQLSYAALNNEHKQLQKQLPPDSRQKQHDNESRSRILSEELYEMQLENAQLRTALQNQSLNQGQPPGQNQSKSPQTSTRSTAKISQYLRKIFK